ncbi:hypothetical protein BTHI11S_03333 [Bosea thiooxidans]
MGYGHAGAGEGQDRGERDREPDQQIGRIPRPEQGQHEGRRRQQDLDARDHRARAVAPGYAGEVADRLGDRQHGHRFVGIAQHRIGAERGDQGGGRPGSGHGEVFEPLDVAGAGGGEADRLVVPVGEMAEAADRDHRRGHRVEGWVAAGQEPRGDHHHGYGHRADLDRPRRGVERRNQLGLHRDVALVNIDDHRARPMAHELRQRGPVSIKIP